MWKPHGWKPIGVYDLRCFFGGFDTSLRIIPCSTARGYKNGSPVVTITGVSIWFNAKSWMSWSSMTTGWELGYLWVADDLVLSSISSFTVNLFDERLLFLPFNWCPWNQAGCWRPSGTWKCHTQPPCFKFSWECIKFLWHILYGSKFNANFFICMFIIFAILEIAHPIFWGTKFWPWLMRRFPEIMVHEGTKFWPRLTFELHWRTLWR